MRADATAILTGWLPDDAGQQQLRADYLAFLSDHEDAISRECRIGHLTASALVMDEARSKVLLTLHPKVGRWLQLGGHCEPGDVSLLEAARRETVEESGISQVRISSQPIRLDRHSVPCAGAMSEHLDVQFLAIVSGDAQEVISDESDDLRWFGLGTLPEGLDASVRALIDAATDGRAIGDFALR